MDRALLWLIECASCSICWALHWFLPLKPLYRNQRLGPSLLLCPGYHHWSWVANCSDWLLTTSLMGFLCHMPHLALLYIKLPSCSLQSDHWHFIFLFFLFIHSLQHSRHFFYSQNQYLINTIFSLPIFYSLLQIFIYILIIVSGRLLNVFPTALQNI